MILWALQRMGKNALATGPGQASVIDHVQNYD